jgi:hypothetical protein
MEYIVYKSTARRVTGQDPDQIYIALLCTLELFAITVEAAESR